MAEPRFWGGDFPWVTPKDMKRSLIGDSKMHVTKAALSETSLTAIPAGSVMLVVRGMILAKRVPIAVATRPVTTNQDMKAIVPGPMVTGRYLGLALECAGDGFAPLIDEAGHGTRRLPTERWRDLLVPVPPPDEQAAIVRFLDHADRRIRRYIRAKQKLIKLLEEQKQAIIHEAVTRGLDPSVPMKDSGVEWLGRVPMHWHVVALRRYWRVLDCKHLTVPFVEEGVPLASVKEAQSFDLHFQSANRTTVEWYERLIEGGRRPRFGDLVYCRNVSVGAAAFVGHLDEFAMGQDVCLIRSDNQNQRWLNYYLHSPAMARQLAMVLVGSTFNRINVADIKSLIVPVPPRGEQDAIAAHLDTELRSFDSARSAALREIALLRELRTRLIADVVTGQLDVRAAAAALPDEPTDDEPLDDADETGDDDLDADGAPEDDDA